MIVLDASVLIAHFDRGDSHHRTAVKHLYEADAPFACSTITLAEVLVGPAREGRVADTQAMLDRLGVQEFALPLDAPERLAALRAETALKLPDCCVLLTAEMVVGGVLTLDGRLRDAAARRGVG